ncbi:MAG: hypothetical protein AAGE92_07015 [Cyanobacteria bacterium P01_G01_bin.4]
MKEQEYQFVGMLRLLQKFPSPWGEMIDERIANRADLSTELMFPSPCGEMIDESWLDCRPPAV